MNWIVLTCNWKRLLGCCRSQAVVDLAKDPALRRSLARSTIWAASCGRVLVAGMLLVGSSAGCRQAAWWPTWTNELENSAAANPVPANLERPLAETSATKPADDQPVAAPTDEDSLFSVADLLVSTTEEGLRVDGWYRPLPNNTPSEEEFLPYRWQHDALDALIDQPQYDLTEALTDSDLSLRATAAIGLARQQGERHTAQLVNIVSASQLSPQLRSAAVETYLQVAPREEAAEQLSRWLDQYAEQMPLHAELLWAAADRFPQELAPSYQTALNSRSAELRRAALEALGQSAQPLPAEALELVDDSDLSVRVAAIRLMGLKPDAQATSRLCAAAHDANLSVRLAAVSALAQHTDLAARTTLLEVLSHDGERVRAAAAAALARRGEWPAVRSAATDKSWLVRREVAAAFDHWQSEQDMLTAYALLEDRSMQVRLQLIDTLRRWPLDEAGPLLIIAASQRTFAPSQLALKQLEQRWPPADSISATAGDPTSPAWQQMTEAFAIEFGSDGRHTPAPVVPTQVEVAPEEYSAQRIALEFQTIGQLSAADLTQRRQAALALEQLAAGRPLSQAVLARLANVAPSDNDPLVWRSILSAIRRNRGEQAARLAYVALSHPDSETRRRACIYLEAHPHASHVTPLAVSLKEQEPRICLAAIAAYSASASAKQLEPLAALVQSPETEIRLAAAVELARKGHSAGYETLEQLAGHRLVGVRRSAVAAMGQLADPLFLPLLIILLEDRYDVRLAALEALSKVASFDPATESVGTQGNVSQRCAAWQRWYAKGGEFAKGMQP